MVGLYIAAKNQRKHSEKYEQKEVKDVEIFRIQEGNGNESGWDKSA